MIKKAFRYFLTIIGLSILIILLFTKREPREHFQPRDYREIVKSGKLRAVTGYNAVSMHLNNDTLDGFDYEILHAFAHDKGLELDITPVTSFNERLMGVIEGRYDILASATPVTSHLKDTIHFCNTLLLNKQVLVQRKGKNKDSLYIKNQLDLANTTLYLTKNSPAMVRIHNLMSEIGDTIYVKEIEKYGSEQLLAMVAAGDIDFAVCDENIAKASLKDFPNLDIQTDIGFTQFYSWGVNKHANELLDTLNIWLDDYLKSKAYKTLYNKYFQ